MNIDCENTNEYIRLFTNYGFNISDMMISDLTIEVGGKDEQKIQKRITRTKNKTNRANKWYIYNSIQAI